jgi:ribokinase
VRAEEGPIVAVLGAINVDLVLSGAPLPGPGETVTGGTFAQHHGGKGGNQAVAAARALSGGRVWMLGAVGDDQLGAAALEALRENAVRTEHVVVATGAPTGVALIAVSPKGENQISVAPGANGTLQPSDVVDAATAVKPRVLLVSLEIPERTVRAALEWSHDHDVTVILDPAPPHPWAKDLLALSTYVTPNEHEREALGATPPVVVIETRGAEGALIHHRDGTREPIPAPAVPVVDTTGAGDCFNGVLAAGLSWGAELSAAVRDAVVAASVSVGTAGAREGMPNPDQIAEARTRLGL